MNSKDKETRAIDPAQQLELLKLQCNNLAPNLYRVYALYLQELRSILLNAARTSVISLITERSSNSFENLSRDAFKTCPNSIDDLVTRCSSLLTIEHVIALGKQLEETQKKLEIAIVGLKALISNNCDTLKIAEKTLQEIEQQDK